MLRKTMVMIVALSLVFAFAGCGTKKEPAAKPAAAKPAIPADIAKTASDILKLSEADDWGAVYEFLNPDIKNQVTKDSFVKTRLEKKQHVKIKYEGYTLDHVKTLPELNLQWNAKTPYKNVAEVYYKVKVKTPKGEKEMVNYLHLVKGTDGKWTYLWSGY